MKISPQSQEQIQLFQVYTYFKQDTLLTNNIGDKLAAATVGAYVNCFARCCIFQVYTYFKQDISLTNNVWDKLATTTVCSQELFLQDVVYFKCTEISNKIYR